MGTVCCLGGDIDVEDVGAITVDDDVAGGAAASSSGAASGGGGGGDAPALVAPPPVPLIDVAARLNLRLTGTQCPFDAYFVTSGKPAARCHIMWGKTAKAVCKVHNDCSLMMNINWYGDWTIPMLLEWVSRANDTSENVHWQMREAILQAAKARANATARAVP